MSNPTELYNTIISTLPKGMVLKNFSLTPGDNPTMSSLCDAAISALRQVYDGRAKERKSIDGHIKQVHISEFLK